MIELIMCSRRRGVGVAILRQFLNRIAICITTWGIPSTDNDGADGSIL